jgi:hypothetical protein
VRLFGSNQRKQNFFGRLFGVVRAEAIARLNQHLGGFEIFVCQTQMVRDVKVNGFHRPTSFFSQDNQELSKFPATDPDFGGSS